MPSDGREMPAGGGGSGNAEGEGGEGNSEKTQAAVVYDLDRLARNPRDLEDAIEVVEYYGGPSSA